MVDKIKFLANTFLVIGIIFGIISFFEVFNLDLLNFRIHWVVFLFIVFLSILFLIIGISLRVVYNQISVEIKAIYKYYDKKIDEIKNDK